jgi:hypothetical protein
MTLESPPRAVPAADPAGDVPAGVRLGAWFFLLASGAGFLGGLLELMSSARTGVFLLPVPLAVGLTGLALFRGLRGGDARAWRWARRIAAAAALGTLLLMILSVIAPAGATFSFMGGSWPAASAVPVLLPTGTLAIGWFVWLFRSLGRPGTRLFFGLASDASARIPTPPKEEPS